MRMVVTNLRKKFRSQARIKSTAFTAPIYDAGKAVIKQVKELYDSTHETWNYHPLFKLGGITINNSQSKQIKFSVILDDAGSDLETDRSPYSPPVSSGQIWRWLDSGVEEAWFFADKGFVSKTVPNFIGSRQGSGRMKYKGRLQLLYHKLDPATIEARNWSVEINKQAPDLFKPKMREASRLGYNAMRRELSKI